MEPKHFKTLAIILLVILGGVIIYHFFSGNSATKELKRLNDELSQNKDSLKIINQQYLSLASNYDSIYSELNSTKNQLMDFKTSIDSVMHNNIKSVKEIQSSVDHLLEDTIRFKPVKIDSTDNFRIR